MSQEQATTAAGWQTGTQHQRDASLSGGGPHTGTALRTKTPPRLHFDSFIGDSAQMRLVYDRIRKFARVDATVLIQGETGTGKEIVARALHALSRPQRPLVAVNCAAFSRDLIASELFGHEKGSFTGASRNHRGCIEQADGGTLFLDEITEMPPPLQVQLLRVLETREFTRVGGESVRRADVRIVAATNQDTLAAVESGVLRKDLFYRLNELPFHLPPLRDREGDVPLLLDYFTGELNRLHETDWRLSDSQRSEFLAYDWPGNVREIKHALHRAFVLGEAESARKLLLGPARTTHERNRVRSDAETRTLAEMEKQAILNRLEALDGDKRRAAESLGICLKTLYNRLKQYEHEMR